MTHPLGLYLLLGAALGTITAFVAAFAPITGLRSGFESASAGVTYSSEVYVPDLHFPTALQFSEDGRLFYNEPCGSVRIVNSAGEVLSTPFVTLDDAVCTGDYALVGLALDPDFEINRYVYVFYMQLLSDSPWIAKPVLMRFTEVNNLGTEPTVILGDLSPTTPGLPRVHGANNIHFGPDRKLYVSLGDLGKHDTQSVQDLTVPEGKILRINSDGSVPPDNPDVGGPGTDERIFAYGFRNSYDFTFHTDDSRIYATENGTNKCDELNIVTAGQNYGWPFAHQGPDTCLVAGGTQAVYWFRFLESMNPWDDDSTSVPTGIIFIDGDEHPLLGDSLLTCEYKSRKLRQLVLSEDHNAVIAEPVIFEGEESCDLGITLAPNGDVYYSNRDSIRRLLISGPTATLTPGETPTTTPTPTPIGGPVLIQGDNDCDADSDSVDALKGLQHIAAIDFSQEPGCPALGGALPAAPAGDPPDLFGDVDCDDDVDSVDQLKILRNVAALPVSQSEPCIDIGETL